MSARMFVLDGATGAGKSSLLAHIRLNYSATMHVARKLTTRIPRKTDNDWEFRFVDRIPHACEAYAYESVGNFYALDADELSDGVRNGRTVCFACADLKLLDRLKQEFGAIVIYVYRPWSDAELDALLRSRATVGPDAERRRHEIASIGDDYTEKMHLIDHVILNVAGIECAQRQLDAIVRCVRFDR